MKKDNKVNASELATSLSAQIFNLINRSTYKQVDERLSSILFALEVNVETIFRSYIHKEDQEEALNIFMENIRQGLQGKEETK